jgi:hypothetical protein
MGEGNRRASSPESLAGDEHNLIKERILSIVKRGLQLVFDFPALFPNPFFLKLLPPDLKLSQLLKPLFPEELASGRKEKGLWNEENCSHPRQRRRRFSRTGSDVTSSFAAGENRGNDFQDITIRFFEVWYGIHGQVGELGFLVVDRHLRSPVWGGSRGFFCSGECLNRSKGLSSLAALL